MNEIRRQLLLTQNLNFNRQSTIQNSAGQTYKVYLMSNQSLPAFIPQQPPPIKQSQNVLGEILLGFGFGVVLIGGFLGIAEFLEELFSPIRNDTPLTASTKRYIRERDAEICFYCGDYAPGGHVDHRVSRANGGGNELENLTWACVFCNCSKGAMNDTDYLRLIEAYY